MVEIITLGGTSIPGLELSLSLGSFILEAISCSVGSWMMMGAGLDLLAVTLILVFGRDSGMGAGFFNFCFLGRIGGVSSSSLESSISWTFLFFGVDFLVP